MFDISEYIESGVLEEYSLGLLPDSEKNKVDDLCREYPAIRTELAEIQQALSLYEAQLTSTPPAALETTIWNTLQNINKENHATLLDLPIINKYSDHNNWKRIVKPLVPAVVNKDDTITKVLRHDSGVTQVLMISSTDVPDEVHENEYESFMVLEGECDCHIGDNIITLGPGGFIDIPLHTHHEVRARSGHVIAIMQRIAIAV